MTVFCKRPDSLAWEAPSHFPDINHDDVRGCYGISKVAIINDPTLCN